MQDTIEYGNLMHAAMRSLIKSVLEQVAQDGLPGAHHFFITFDTTHPDVAIADWLHDRYPEEMTIVMQHWFDNLTVTDDGFGVTLNFGDAPEPLYIPYEALKTFVDPSVEFGLRFETAAEDDEDEPDLEELLAPTDEDEIPDAPETDEPHKDAEVVSLDSFRK
ncbi:MAG: ClpXP protease specificity-enhancing factor SspB [Marinibacterium sp.]|nr:ClpXP protease specificity-enhancing factor SspB [Marinibacterium sp.]